MGFILAGGIFWSWRHRAAAGDAVTLAMKTTIAIAGMSDDQSLITYPNWPRVRFRLAVGAEVTTRNAGREAAGCGRAVPSIAAMAARQCKMEGSAR